MTETHDAAEFDVVVIGGGAAGLSAAVALARSRRSVLVVDDGSPRNAPAAHVHNFLTRDGASPAQMSAIGRDEVTRYGGLVESARVTALSRAGAGFRVELGPRVVTARRLLVATGVQDELPDIDGLAARWGIDVLHCPYCHGWEVRDRRIGVLATGPAAVHQALMFRQLSNRVTVLAHTGPALDDDQIEQLNALGIEMVDGQVVAVEADDDGLVGVRLGDGRRVEIDALVVAPRAVARAELLAPLGLVPIDVLMGDHVIGTTIAADPMGKTAVAGVWVAGNLASVQAQVVSSAAAGLMAGAAINADLIAEDAALAVQAYRYERVYGVEAWEERYQSRPHAWSGNPNPVLVTEIAELKPGSALDAGAGEGADACWLAERGWQVTALDLSTTAIGRASAEAERLGLDIDWRVVDLTQNPALSTYDLVSSFYVHQPPEPRRAVFARLADAVAPGGTLLIVGHDPSDMHTHAHRAGLAEMGWFAGDVADSLGPGWTVDVAEARARTTTGPDGELFEIRDAVMRARKTG